MDAMLATDLMAPLQCIEQHRMVIMKRLKLFLKQAQVNIPPIEMATHQHMLPQLSALIFTLQCAYWLFLNGPFLTKIERIKHRSNCLISELRLNRDYSKSIKILSRKI